MTTLPIEILDLILDTAVEGMGIRSVFGVTFTPELVTLLQEIALVSHHLRERAQRHLFQEIRLYASVILDDHNDPVVMEKLLSIFEENPKILTYPRSLSIVDPEHARARHSVFSPHFLSVMFPFFINKLRNLDHFCFSPKVDYYWTGVPSNVWDALVGCIRGNRLKSITIRNFDLPRDLGTFFPSTLEALNIGAYVRNDNPSLAAKNINPGNCHRARPTHIVVGFLSEDKTWISSQADDLFTRIKSLDITVLDVPSLATFLGRMVAHKLTHLSLHSQGSELCMPIPCAIRSKG
jgi:hypothetical protein